MTRIHALLRFDREKAAVGAAWAAALEKRYSRRCGNLARK